MMHADFRWEQTMPLADQLFLALVVLAFGTFAAVLAYGSIVASGKK
jgi:hypothetical protein